MRAGYFGRDLDYTIYRFPRSKIITCNIMFNTIESVLPDLYGSKSKLCLPLLVIESFENNELNCCYTWQLK
jgi:hypothetical protein